MKHVSDVHEKQWDGKTIYTFDLTLGINLYKYVTFWGSLDELKKLDACDDILGTYKFYAKISNKNGKVYYNKVIHLPNSQNSSPSAPTQSDEVKW